MLNRKDMGVRRVRVVAMLLLVTLVVFQKRLFFQHFVVVGLFNYLPTLLFARGKEILNRDIIFWLYLYLLLVVEYGNHLVVGTAHFS